MTPSEMKREVGQLIGGEAAAKLEVDRFRRYCNCGAELMHCGAVAGCQVWLCVCCRDPYLEHPTLFSSTSSIAGDHPPRAADRQRDPVAHAREDEPPPTVKALTPAGRKR